MTLQDFFKENPIAALAFSGGVDSSYLLYAGLRFGASIKAYFVKTAFQPQHELQDAISMAKYLDTDINVINADILNNTKIVSNAPDRCYHCKSAIFNILTAHVRTDDIPLIIDGTNASDNTEDRPGSKALLELSVRSPLRECGITKSEVRRLSKEAGLFTWDKPAYACLATRIPSGTLITKELLERVEAAENALFSLGFSAFRVRVFSDAARLQFLSSQLTDVLVKRIEIINAIKPFFPAVFLDLEARYEQE